MKDSGVGQFTGTLLLVFLGFISLTSLDVTAWAIFTTGALLFNAIKSKGSST